LFLFFLAQLFAFEVLYLLFLVQTIAEDIPVARLRLHRRRRIHALPGGNDEAIHMHVI
jgi:hypothetical protein